MTTRIFLVAATIAASAGVLADQPARPDTMSARAGVVDGDTIRLGAETVRLHGIDAPEAGQTCTDESGRAYGCGRAATRALERLIGTGSVTCREIDRDRHGRLVAVCRAGRTDLGGAMVASGWALAFRRYSDAYLEPERAAARARAGVWAGGFEAPWEWRAARATLPPPPPIGQACRIKGNISDNGRIYHVPGSEHYDRVGISERRGERWFCSVGEAEAAGWRAPRG